VVFLIILMARAGGNIMENIEANSGKQTFFGEIMLFFKFLIF
jgi:hypothetical protein